MCEYSTLSDVSILTKVQCVTRDVTLPLSCLQLCNIHVTYCHLRYKNCNMLCVMLMCEKKVEKYRV